VPIYSLNAIDAIEKGLKAELVKILMENAGIIKISDSKISEINRAFEKNRKNKKVGGEIPGYVLQILGGKLERWETEKKISSILKQKFDKNQNEAYKVYLSTFRTTDKKEEKELLSKLREQIQKKKGSEFYENEYLNTFTAELTKTDLEELSSK